MSATGSSNKRTGAPVASTFKPKKAKKGTVVYHWDIINRNDKEQDDEEDEVEDEEDDEVDNNHHKNKNLCPSYLLVHTLPNQDNNGGGLFTYPTWPPGRVHSAGLQPGPLGIEAAASNVPPEWTLLLGLANAFLHQDRGVFPVVPVGAPGALIGFAATADYPYFLCFQCPDHRRFALAYMRGYLEHKFGSVLGSFSYSCFSTNTAATIPALKDPLVIVRFMLV